MSEYILEAKNRSDLGKGASRRLRRNEGMIPAVIYGGKTEAKSISLFSNKVEQMFANEGAFSHILSINVEGSAVPVVVKALQRHPSKGFIMHADFMRVDENEKLTAHIPLHIINEDSSIGIKQQGGSLSRSLSEVEVSCLPKHLPEFIEVDLSEVQAGQVVHLKDLKLPEGVELVPLLRGRNLPVAMIKATKG